MLSFLLESRRVDNRRMLADLGLRLQYPTLQSGVTRKHRRDAARAADWRNVTFHNRSLAAIHELLRTSHTIAVVGISDDPARPSFGVTTSMRDFGYRILPVNPALTLWQGVPAHPSWQPPRDHH